MEEALKLMLTGMSTVFFVLIMVVVLGNLIIRLTNKYSVVPLTQPANGKASQNEIEASKLVAIVSAVHISTKGKGTITSIEKMN